MRDDKEKKRLIVQPKRVPKQYRSKMSDIQRLGIFVLAGSAIKFFHPLLFSKINYLMISFFAKNLNLEQRNLILVTLVFAVAFIIHYLESIYIAISERHRLFLRENNKMIFNAVHLKFFVNASLAVFIGFIFLKYVPAFYRVEIGKNFVLFFTIMAFCFFTVRVIAFCVRHYPYRM